MPDEPKILVIDDDEVDIRAIKRGLEKARITNEVIVAHDGLEGIEMLRGSESSPALDPPFIILLDLNMPRMTGLEFLDELRADPRLKRHIVFILTTSDDDKDKAAAYDKNVAGYINKSQAGEDFLGLIHMIENFLITIRFPPNF